MHITRFMVPPFFRHGALAILTLCGRRFRLRLWGSFHVKRAGIASFRSVYGGLIYKSSKGKMIFDDFSLDVLWTLGRSPSEMLPFRGCSADDRICEEAAATLIP
ncbi:MAG: hypothetical protein SPI19_05575 [Peptoniphilaceae bacterium]|nr:hypothetical protein [Peptoniphilaceae bacterium]